MAKIQLNLNVKNVKRKVILKMVLMSAHNVNILRIKNAFQLNLNVKSVISKVILLMVLMSATYNVNMKYIKHVLNL